MLTTDGSSPSAPPDRWSVVSELNLLRNVEANNPESGAAAKSSSLLSSFRSNSSYNHETETIFALPRMQLDFKSIHVQDPDEPSLSGAAQETPDTSGPLEAQRYLAMKLVVLAVEELRAAQMLAS